MGKFLVDRNFLDKDVEVINQHKKYPSNVRKLLRSYPNIIATFNDNHIIFKDGKRLLFDDNKTKTPDE